MITHLPQALLEAVMALEQPPKLWLCGHIHDGRGAYDIPHPRGACDSACSHPCPRLLL